MTFLVSGLLTLSLLAVSACGTQNTAKQDTGPASSKTVQLQETINGTAYTMTFDSVPQRAVSLSQFSTELLLALGLQEKMVGTAFLEEPISPKVKEAYAKVPVLSEKWPAQEVFFQAKPDFAIGWEVAFSKKGVEAANVISQGIKVFIPKSTTESNANMDTLFEDIRTLGAIFDVRDRAESYIQQEQQRIKTVQEKLAKLPPRSVFIFDSGDQEPFTVYEGFTSHLLLQAGMKNVMAGKGVKKTWGKANWEEVIAANPDYILIVEYDTANRGQSDYESKVQYLKENPRLQTIKAVQKQAFLRVRLAEIVPGIRNVDLLERLAAQRE